MTGLREILTASVHAEKSTKLIIRGKFREAGEIVQHDATERFDPYDARTASNFRTVVRVRGVSVEQRLRKTTGLRPDFGILQMRKALVPALEENTGAMARKLDEGLIELATILNRA